jgi:hypothetical protein
MKAKSFFLLIFILISCPAIWAGNLDGLRLSIAQLLQARAGLEKFGYTPTEILKKRLSSFTQDLWTDLKTQNSCRIGDYPKRSYDLFERGLNANLHMDPLEKSSLTQRQTSVADIADMQINNENYFSTFNQKLPSVSMFDDRNFMAVWEDERNGDIDIFAQKMSFLGAPTGNNFEVSTESFPKNQLSPCVATIEDTAFVVIWVDEENFDIYGRRFGSDLLPRGDVFQVNDAGIPSTAPSLSCGPDGGFVVAWVDTRSGNNIYAKRFSPLANPLGSSFKVNEDAGTMLHLSPSVSVGQSGNFVIVWEDFRNLNSDIYAQRYGSAGDKLGVNIKVNSDSLSEDQYSPSVSVGKNDRFTVGWVDLRSGIKNMFARFFSSSGAPVASVLQVDTFATSYPRENPWVGSDTTGRYMIAWADYTPSFPTIYTQTFDSLGQAIGSRLRISDQEATGERHNPALSTNPAGAFAVCWMDKRKLNYDVYAQTVRSDGFLQQQQDFPVNDDLTGANQMFPRIKTKSDGDFMVVWEDFRNDNSDIYLKRFDLNGNPLGDDFRVNDSLGYVYHGLPQVACDESGDFVVVWEDERGELDIYGQLFDHLGNLVGANFKVNGDSGTDLHNSPSCDMSKSGDFAVVWSANAGSVKNIYGRLFGSNGQPKDTCFKINDADPQVDDPVPKVSLDSLGNFVVAWKDKRSGQEHIYLQRYDHNGVKMGVNFQVNSDNPDPTQSEPDLDLNKKGEFVVVWVESEKILAQRYDNSAAPVGNNIVVVDNPSSYPEDPQVKMTDDGYFVTAWTDHRGEGSDIYFQSYLNGSPQGLNHLVNTDTGQALQISPGIDLWGNFLYSVWMDNRIPGHGFDVFFSTVTFKATGVEDDEEENDLPERFVLCQNYPNPFNPSTKILFTVHGSQFTVPGPIPTSLKIYNVLGQKVRTLVDEPKKAGSYEVIWDGKDDQGKEAASGIYFYQLRTKDQILTKKMLLLR